MRLAVNTQSGTIHKGRPRAELSPGSRPRAACNPYGDIAWYRPHRLCHTCFNEEERKTLAKIEETKGRKSNAGRMVTS